MQAAALSTCSSATRTAMAALSRTGTPGMVQRQQRRTCTSPPRAFVPYPFAWKETFELEVERIAVNGMGVGWLTDVDIAALKERPVGYTTYLPKMHARTRNSTVPQPHPSPTTTAPCPFLGVLPHAPS